MERKSADNKFKYSMYIVLAVVLGTSVLFSISSTLLENSKTVTGYAVDNPFGITGNQIEDNDDGKGGGELPEPPPECPVGKEVGNSGTGVSTYECVESEEKLGCVNPQDEYSCPNSEEECCLVKNPTGCPKTHFKCDKTEKIEGDAVCCIKGVEECFKTSRIAPGPPLNYCAVEEDKCREGQVRCTGGESSAICCDEVDGMKGQEVCGTQKLVPYCKNDNDNKCESDETPCTKGLCCDNETESCDTFEGRILCQPKTPNSCDTAAGETYCSGTGDFSEIKKCCAKGATCARHENGYPYCF